MSILQKPIQLGAFELKNRLVMAPLTRCRASEGRVPNELMAEYYAQRASAGLILSEATSVNPMGVGYPDTPGLWSADQVEGWKMVTSAVHKKGGLILAQLWHVGRISDPSYLNGELPVAPSPIAPDGHVSLIRPQKPFVTPRALTVDEIKATIEDYRVAAEHAKAAGFDGVELHGANGYLPEQFLHSSTNHRTDEYGGSIENRARFLLEALDALISVWGAERVGLHLSPQGDAHDAGDATPLETNVYLAEQSKQRGIAFIFLREDIKAEKRLTPVIKETFGNGVIANQELNKEQAETLVESGVADAVSFGRWFIANPDLPQRFAQDAPLNEADPNTFYGGGSEGYTDYPFLNGDG
ncbi:alkene reductase [Sulfuriroseicoccus oceanibius]|uniref:Alkene reductase n=1 Tax=Sulfuriroseicoccus oceanibius TaxID=2707525 RepID=A0A6B3L855_9BACT|nr:alkene reductase [Sulfuriroseicoccus oceanibius]QQL45917.1 alkene reductase [Sulfuriroseicoccus oceanibius]